MTTEKRERREFDATFKLQVVQMIREQGLTLSGLCREMDLTPSAVRRWVRQYDAERAGRPGAGKPRSLPSSNASANSKARCGNCERTMHC